MRTWTHTFVCLSRITSETIPNTKDRTRHKLAGWKRDSLFLPMQQLKNYKMNSSVNSQNWRMVEALNFSGHQILAQVT